MSAAQRPEERFPDDVIVLLHNANITVSCVPIQIDDGIWQAAIFFVLPADAPCLTGGRLLGGPYSVEFDADLHEHEKGTLIEIGFRSLRRSNPAAVPCFSLPAIVRLISRR